MNEESAVDNLNLTHVAPPFDELDVRAWLDDGRWSQVLRDSPAKKVYRVDLGRDEAGLFVKKWYEKGRIRTLKNFMRGASRAAREARNLRVLEDYRVPVPDLVASGEYAVESGPGKVSFMVTREIGRARILHSYSQAYYAGSISGATMDSLTRKTGALIAHLHLCGITHHDLNIENILVRENPGAGLQLFLLDPMGVCRHEYRWPHCLRDMGEFYLAALRDRSGMVLRPSEADRILEEYFVHAGPLYPFGWSHFKALVGGIAGFLDRAYVVRKSFWRH